MNLGADTGQGLQSLSMQQQASGASTVNVEQMRSRKNIRHQSISRQLNLSNVGDL